MKYYEIPPSELAQVFGASDPYPALDHIRNQCPIAHESVTNSWVLLSHNEVEELLRDPIQSRDPRNANQGTVSWQLYKLADEQGNEHSANMLFLDPPEHTRIRRLVHKAFTLRTVERLTDRIEARVSELLDVVDGDTGFDVMKVLAIPLPTIVIAELLGVNPDHHDRFKKWSDEAIKGLDVTLPAAQRAQVVRARDEFSAYLYALMEERRGTEGDDLIRELLRVQEGDDRLTDLEVMVTCRTILAAGNLTTTDLIGNAVYALLKHPQQLALLRAEPERMAKAVEEVLRYDTPVVAATRIVSGSLELHGCTIPEGDTVLVSLSAANRDPEVYPNPHGFDISRKDTHHQSFGGGRHFCLGAHLARLETKIALSKLLTRFPALRLIDNFKPQYNTLNAFRGLKTLPVIVSRD